jgi:hypothetical protein
MTARSFSFFGRGLSAAIDSAIFVGSCCSPRCWVLLPSMLSKLPSLLGELPSLLGELPSMLGELPSMLGEASPRVFDSPEGAR